MRVVAFANNRVGHEVVRWLADSDDANLVGLVLHPEEERAYGDEILEAGGLPGDRVLLAPRLGEKEGIRALGEWEGDVGLSLYFKYLLEPAVFTAFPEGCLNLHPSYLPYNRGVHTNVWSLVEETPTGASLHVVDEGVDTGPVLARRRVEPSPTDTGATLHRRLEDACIRLFREAWPRFVRGELEPEPQSEEEGTTHVYGDVEAIDRIDLDRETTARELIDRLRARTFPPYRGCYFEHEGRRIYLRLGLWEEDEYPPEDADTHHEDERARREVP